MAQRKPIENLVRIPSEGSGPVWMDTVGNSYPEVRDAFMHMLRTVFPTIAVMEHKLPPSQRENTTAIPHVPNVNAFYPVGIMAPYVQITPEAQEAINNVYVEIGKAIQRACAEGHENGKNLLVGLAKGTITISDFDTNISLKKEENER